MQSILAPYKRLTIKVGSALLVDDETGGVREHWLASLAEDIAGLAQRGCEIVIVSSGAVSLGRRILGITAKALHLDESQAAAAAGQIALSQAWRDALIKHDITTGQILITPNITEERRYYLNARTTIRTLLGFGAIPIINENDSVATAEIRYGDNDRLSARVAVMVEADCLILLSDVDGLYTAPPATHPDAEHMPLVEEITPEIEAMAGGAASHLSRGGMSTKIEAAKIATKSGTAMIVTTGSDMHPLKALDAGALHTLFAAVQSPSAARKRWILGSLESLGTIHIDPGAVRALEAGKSLLPIGVTKVRGDFSRGDAVSIVGPDGTEVARGLAGMSTEEASIAKGKKSSAIADMVGIGNRTEMVHADNLALLSTKWGGHGK